jgi:uncharacterized protein (DUF362 family)
MSAEVKVAVQKGDQKLELLDETLKLAGFFDHLEASRRSSGKSKRDFSVVVKPNMMMFSHKETPPATYTDMELVEHLFDLLQGEGYESLKLVESQNVYGNWYQNRGVVNVAKVSGHRPDLHGYEVVDLTEDRVPYQYDGRWLKDHFVGKAWLDADYRISFAKNKTHVYDYYTLNLKNIYGVTPLQDKMFEYHALREWHGVTFDMLKCFPVDFGIIDAFYSSDGFLGFKGTFKPKKTEMIIASPSLMAADIVGSRMMGLDPRGSLLMRLCQDEWGVPTIEQVGNVEPGYVHPNWVNIVPIKRKYPDVLSNNFLHHLLNEEIPEFMGTLLQGVATFFEEDYLSITIGGIVTGGIAGDTMDPEAFPLRRWDQLANHVKEHTIENLQDLIFNVKRHRSILWEIRELWRSIWSLFQRRTFSKDIDNSLEKALDKLRESLD